MVRLVVKRGDQVQFLFETTTGQSVSEATNEIVAIYNLRLKVERICSELDQLRQHGIHLPPEQLGLTDQQVEELHLKDPLADTCVPSGGYSECPDPCGRRCGRAPREEMGVVLGRAADEARAIVSRGQAECGVALTESKLLEAVSLLRGAVMIVYPMQLPPYDPIRMELEDREQLAGTQAGKEVIEPALAQLWFSGRELEAGKVLSDYVGRNEKTRVVLKLQRRGQGAPAREPLLSEQQQKQLMLAEYRRREELRRLDADRDQTHLDSGWSDPGSLKRAFHGLSNVSWRPK